MLPGGSQLLHSVYWSLCTTSAVDTSSEDIQDVSTLYFLLTDIFYRRKQRGKTSNPRSLISCTCKTTWLWLVGRMCTCQLEPFSVKGKSRTALSLIRRMHSGSKSNSCCILFLRLAGTRNILLIKYYHVGNFVHRFFWNDPGLMWTTLRVHWSEVDWWITPCCDGLSLRVTITCLRCYIRHFAMIRIFLKEI